MRETEIKEVSARQSRREWLNTVARAGAAGVAASVLSPHQRLFASRQRNPSIDVGIVGAGIAGLACADTLADSGVCATVYEAGTRVGGRCVSLRNFFPGQVAERGGEFIDTPHKTMLRYARRFDLALEDVSKEPGEVFYHFGGHHIPESTVVDEFRDFVQVMRLDLRKLSNEVTALAHTDADVTIDRTSLAGLSGGSNGANRAAGPIAKAAIIAAYIAEYGLEPDQQSCLNFLLFIHADRRSKFTPFGVFSDERYHVLDGNDRIVEGLARGAATARRARHDAESGPGNRRRPGRADVRDARWCRIAHARCGRPRDPVHDAAKRRAQHQSGSCSGKEGSDRPSRLRDERQDDGRLRAAALDSSGQQRHGVRRSRESRMHLGNKSRKSDIHSRRADRLSGGDRGASLDPGAVQLEAGQYLADLNLVFPGAHAAARRVKGNVVAHLEHWPSNPLALGSYTCYMPGQFTTIAGLEGLPVGNVFFAGEHANSFYEWQGFMEGAALSGVDVAAAILKAAR